MRRNGKTMAPVGTWTDFSEKFAQTLGYKFEVLEGVLFDKEFLFKK